MALHKSVTSAITLLTVRKMVSCNNGTACPTPSTTGGRGEIPEPATKAIGKASCSRRLISLMASKIFIKHGILGSDGV